MLMPYAPMAPSLFSFFVSSKREAWTTWFWLPLMLAVTTKPSAAAEMQRGNGCSPVLCGNVTISSPFGLVSEQSSTETTCGDLGFKVHCFNNTPYLGFFQKQRFQILNIFYDNGSMIVADVHKLQDFNSYNCHSPRVNSTSKLGFPFSISPVNQNLIFYNCTKVPIPASTKGLVEMGCGNNTFVRVAERYYESGSYGSYSLEGCSATLVPVLPGQRRSNASNYEELISDGFLLTWQQPSSPPLSGEKRPKLNIKLILVVLLSASTSLILTCLIWIKYCRKEKHTLSIQNFTRNASKIEEILEGYDSLVPKMYKYSELKKITGSFKDKLGEGGYSVVFKGNLEDGRDVAVKLLKGSKGNGEEFLNEVISIRMTSHVNVVNLIGFCLCGSTRALVYEYMDNGSLEKYIYSEESKMSIGWERLQQIAIGTARGLEYLHRGCNTRIIHFDIKPHNILLDKDFCPKIADFGLAKLCHLKDSSALSMAEAKGTIGFIAPEVFSRGFGVVSTKSDVYSYGMMLLEMVGGRKNVKENTGNSCEAYFPNYIYDCLVKDFQSQEVISEMEEIARQMTLVGLWCIQTNPKNRPSMGTVIDMLEKNINELEMPPKPFLSCPSVASSSLS